jgi:Ca2+-binding RTX toxin-like protein
MGNDNSKRMVFEGLEERRMMSGGGGDPSPTPPPQLIWPLVVNGSLGDDVIKVYQSGLNIVVTNNGVTNYYSTLQTSTVSIYGKDGSDLIDCSGMGREVYVEGGNQADTIIGGSGNDTVYGAGPYTGMYSWADYCADSIDGGSGNDQLFAAHWASLPKTNGGPGNDTIYGSAGDDVIAGEDGNDQIFASHGNNVIDGGDDNDLIDAGIDADLVYGGLGNDTISTGGGNDTVRGATAPDQIVPWFVTDGADQINAGDGSNKVYGDLGDDTITTGSGNDSVWGGWGNDKIVAGDGYDQLFGEGGDDSLDGGAKNDFMDGGAGNDALNPGAGPVGNDNDTDTMVGGSGTDTVSYAGRFSELQIYLNGTFSSGAVTYDAYGQKQYPEHEYIAGDVENAIGSNYNDLITGNALPNALSGEGGNDTIYGGAGNDTLSGSYGDDALYGEDGSDLITADWGKDRLYAGHDNDTLDGGGNDDLFITVGGGSDTVIGGPTYYGEQGDYFWAGPEDSINTNAWVQGTGNVHVIGSFINGASTDLAGQDLPDPAIGDVDCKPDCNPFYSVASHFANVPLFQPGGPSRDDIKQQRLGDCYFLAPLAGIAAAHPEVIRRSVTELGDGTYAVRFFDAGAERFIRVDGQLPVEYANWNYNLTFAAAARGTLWAPIMEKAWAWFRTSDHSYAEIEGSVFNGGTPWETYDAFNLYHETDTVAVHSKDSYMTKMKNWLANGGIVSASTYPFGTDVASAHVYTVVSISADLKSITLRNPWRTDDEGFKDANPNDGYITISVDQFDDDFVFISYASV